MTNPVVAAVETRGLPQAAAAERAVLGAILLTGLLPETPLSADDFGMEWNRAIYRRLCEQAHDGEPLDPVALSMWAMEREAKTGGAAYIASLTDGLPRGLNQEHYCRIVSGAATRRRAIALALELAESAYAGASPDELAGRFLAAHESLLSSAETAEQRSRAVMLVDDLDRETAQYAREIAERRMPTGIGALDDVIGGISAGQVLTIMARTGVGKSAIAQNMARAFLGRATESSVVFCSAEMPGVDLWLRQLQIESGMAEGHVVYRLREGMHPAPEFRQRAQKRFAALTGANITLRDVGREIEHLRRRGAIHPPAMVIFDYAKLFRGDRVARNDTELVGEVARQVKIFAKRENVAAVLLSQVGRTAGDGTTPVTLNDARDSGEIEECADFLVGAWRPALKEGNPTLMRMALLKGRRCPLVDFDCYFEGRTLRLESERGKAAGAGQD